jgi:hypothetical protein
MGARVSTPSGPGLEPRDPDDALCDTLLEYLTAHPLAMDTAQGIAEWWIPRTTDRVEIESVARALRRLTERGLLEELGAGTNRRYRLRTSAYQPRTSRDAAR